MADPVNHLKKVAKKLHVLLKTEKNPLFELRGPNPSYDALGPEFEKACCIGSEGLDSKSTLMQVQHHVAKFHGFESWKNVVKAKPLEVQIAILNKAFPLLNGFWDGVDDYDRSDTNLYWFQKTLDWLETHTKTVPLEGVPLEGDPPDDCMYDYSLFRAMPWCKHDPLLIVLAAITLNCEFAITPFLHIGRALKNPCTLCADNPAAKNMKTCTECQYEIHREQNDPGEGFMDPSTAWSMTSDLPDGAAFAMFGELTGGLDPSALVEDYRHTPRFQPKKGRRVHHLSLLSKAAPEWDWFKKPSVMIWWPKKGWKHSGSGKGPLPLKTIARHSLEPWLQKRARKLSLEGGHLYLVVQEGPPGARDVTVGLFHDSEHLVKTKPIPGFPTSV